MIVLLLLLLGKPDTLAIEYKADLTKEWQCGYIVTEVIDRTESIIHYCEPTAWFDKNKNPIEKPKKHFIK